MTTATKAARPRTTHAQHNGAQHNGAQHNGAQHNGAQHNGAQHNGAQHNGAQDNGAQDNGAQDNGAQDNGVAAIDAGLARITQTAAAGVSLTSNVADDIVTSLGRELTVIVRSVVRLAQELSGRVAGEFGKVVGLNVDDEQQDDLCLGDPTAWV